MKRYLRISFKSDLRCPTTRGGVHVPIEAHCMRSNTTAHHAHHLIMEGESYRENSDEKPHHQSGIPA